MPQDAMHVKHATTDKNDEAVSRTSVRLQGLLKHLRNHQHLLIIGAASVVIVTGVVTAASVRHEARIRESARHKLLEAYMAVQPYYDKVRVTEARYGGAVQAEAALARLEPTMHKIADGNIAKPSVSALLDGRALQEYIFARDNRQALMLGKLELQHIRDYETAAILTAYRSIRPGTEATTIENVPFEDEALLKDLIAALE